MKTFRQELAAYLAKSKEKPYKLAKRAGVSMVAVYGFINGTKDLTLATVEKLKAVMK